MEQAEIHKVLVGAINAIQKHGFIKNQVGNPNIGFCIHGAINYAATGYSEYGDINSIMEDEVFVCVRNHLPEGYGGESWKLEVAYNNAPLTTKEDVLELLRKAAASCAPKPNMEFLNEDSSRAADRGSDSRETALARA